MKLAIVKLSALGDIVHALVAVQFIKAHDPDIEIDWIVEERYAEILANNPDINNILTVNLKALKANKSGFFRQFKKIIKFADNSYDLVIDAQGLIKSAVIAKLILPGRVRLQRRKIGRQLAQPKKRIAGFDANSAREKAASWFYGIKVACSYAANTIDRNAMILSRPIGFDITTAQILNKQPFLFFNDEDPQIYDFLAKERLNIVLVIGSTWESRNYPAERFVKIAVALQQNCLVIWGSDQEKATADWMAAQTDYVKVMPKLDLNSLKALIAKAYLLIGNDTGPTHMAWALNRPSITIFGPTPVSRVYQTEINKVVKSTSSVNPHRLNKLDYSIRDIDEQLIIEQARLLLRR